MEKDRFLVGIYDDEDALLNAIKSVRGAGIRIYECYTPYPIHGLGHALGYKRSRLPIAAFMFGLLGTTLALLMQYYMLGIDWPMNIGGKDYTALPLFIPITFEVTVLLSALGMVAVFMVISDLRPYGKAKVFDLRATDDKMIMAISLSKNKINLENIKDILTDSGASEIHERNF